MEGYVYMIINTKNNKMYIGSTVDYSKRKRSHLNALLGQYHDNIKLQQAFNEYGEDYFKFVLLCQTSNEAERYEIEEGIIQALKTYISGYNLSIDGRGKYLLSDETREKMRINSLGEKNPFYGKTHTDEIKESLSRHASTRTGEKNPFYGRTHTKETLECIAESFNTLKESGWVSPQKGVSKSPEAIHNNMMAQPARKSISAEGKEYPSISACAKDLEVARATIRNRLKNEKFPDYFYIIND